MARQTTRATAPKVSAFMAKLFDPLPDAEILDPDLAKIERKAAREEQRRVEREWSRRKMAVDLAFFRMRVAQYERLMVINETGAALEGIPEQARAQRNWHTEAEKMIRVPAPDTKAIRWKRETFAFKHEHQPWMDEAIAADEKRLAKKAA